MEDRIIGYDDLDENNSQSEFEEMVSQMLLVELFNAKKAEVFENVVFEGKKRYYIEDLTERDYRLENTTPYQLEILGHAIEETSWTHLLEKVAKLLLDIFPQKRVTIIDFRCPWSKAAMFSTEPRTNFREVTDGLYVNCNHTALHACWFLQDKHKRELANLTYCKACGRRLKKSKFRPKKFCDDDCRMYWWKHHRDEVNKKAFYTHVCGQCGREFTVYGKPKQKYCSWECYLNHKRRKS